MFDLGYRTSYPTKLLLLYCMKTDRTCPGCSSLFSAVADYCICPDCNRRFYASDPSRPVEFRMPAKLVIHATTAGSHEENGILNLCFDNGTDGYLLLTRVSEEFICEYDDEGGVYVEVNSQIVACTDGFIAIDLAPGELLVQFRDDSVMKGLLLLQVTFDIGDQFIDLAENFGILMRGKPQFTLQHGAPTDEPTNGNAG